MDTSYEKLFSIIIPTYNSAQTISFCLHSILEQTFNNYEILIIDGLSKDDTLAIVSSFQSDKIFISSQKDDGIYDAMNKGIRLAKGKWLYFLGSDDSLYNNNVLLKISHTINQHPETKFIYGDVYTSTQQTERYTNYHIGKLLEKNICHQAIFYHRSLFKKELYNLQYKVFSDWDFNLKQFRKENYPVYIDQLIAKFNLNGVSGNWITHPEYLDNFSDKKNAILKYRGKLYLFGYCISGFFKKIKANIKWMFQ